MDTPPPIQPPSPEVPAVSSNDKLLAVLCHGSPFIGLAIIVPLIVYLVKKDEAGFVADQAKEALNFHITALIASVVAMILILAVIGTLILALIALAILVLMIVAIIKVIDGKPYRYPMILRLVK